MKKMLILLMLMPNPGFCVDLTITIPDAVAPRVIAAFSSRFGYSPTIQDPNDPNATIPNPQSRVQFVKRYLADYIRGIVIDVEADNAGKQARQNTLTQSGNEINVTAP